MNYKIEKIKIMKTKIKKLMLFGVFLSISYGFQTSENLRGINSNWSNHYVSIEDSTLQNSIYYFYSDSQLDITLNGSRKEGKRNVHISFEDPKPNTKGNEDFDNLPKGSITIKYDGLNPIKDEIVYLGKNKSNAEIYLITKTQQDYDILYVFTENHKVGDKNCSHTIMLGKANLNNLGGMPLYFTAYHCNKTSK